MTPPATPAAAAYIEPRQHKSKPNAQVKHTVSTAAASGRRAAPAVAATAPTATDMTAIVAADFKTE